MPANQEAVYFGILLNGFPGFFRQGLHILTVFKDRHPFPMLVRDHAVESFQHLVTLDEEPSLPEMIVRQNRAPDRVRMQHRPRIQTANDRNMEQRFRRWFAPRFRHDLAFGVDLENLFLCQGAFIQGTGGDGEAKWRPAYHAAEVSAGT